MVYVNMMICLTDYTTTTLIAMANDLSLTIDNFATQPDSVDDAESMYADLRDNFLVIVEFLETARGVVKSDAIRCPEYL